MRQTKHRYEVKKRKLNIKKVGMVFLIFIIVLISVVFIISSTYGKVLQSDNNEIIEEAIPEEEPEVEIPEQFEIVDTSDLPEKYQGHIVLGKIVIEKLGVTQKIFEDTTKEALKIGVTKFWGPDLNEPRQFMPFRT